MNKMKMTGLMAATVLCASCALTAPGGVPQPEARPFFAEAVRTCRLESSAVYQWPERAEEAVVCPLDDPRLWYLEQNRVQDHLLDKVYEKLPRIER